MARFTSMLNVRVRPGVLDALDWYARAAGVDQAVATRFFLPHRRPDEDDVAAETIEQLCHFAEAEQEVEISGRELEAGP